MTRIDHDGGDEDRRNAPPADPWLESAPTTPFDAASDISRTLIDDSPPRRGRRGWWFALVALVLAGCVGGLLLNPFDDEKTPGRAGPTPQASAPAEAEPSAATGAPADANPGAATGAPAGANPGAPTEAPAPGAATTGPAGNAEATTQNVTRPPANQVVYLVSSTSAGDRASVEYTDEDRDIVRKGEVALPWRHTFEFDGSKPPLVVIAQRKQGGTGPVTCSITLGGKELTTAVQRGRYASPQCSG